MPKINYPCHDCGKPRLVSETKIKEGKLKYCHRCSPKYSIKTVRTISQYCKTCGDIFPTSGGSLFCSSRCEAKSKLTSRPMQDIINEVLKRKL